MDAARNVAGLKSAKVTLLVQADTEPPMDSGTLIATPRLSATMFGLDSSLPNNFDPRHSFMKSRDAFLESTVRAVEHAVHCAYNEQLQSWTDFMQRIIIFKDPSVSLTLVKRSAG